MFRKLIVIIIKLFGSYHVLTDTTAFPFVMTL